MIISCPNCNKQFKIDNSLIPDEGRDLQCGSCNHVWFYNPRVKDIKKDIKQEVEINISERPIKKQINKSEQKVFEEKDYSKFKDKIFDRICSFN